MTCRVMVRVAEVARHPRGPKPSIEMSVQVAGSTSSARSVVGVRLVHGSNEVPLFPLFQRPATGSGLVNVVDVGPLLSFDEPQADTNPKAINATNVVTKAATVRTLRG